VFFALVGERRAAASLRAAAAGFGFIWAAIAKDLVLRMRIRNIAALSRLIAQHSEKYGALSGKTHSAIPSVNSATRAAFVSFRAEDGYSLIELHNPQARNALTPLM